MRSVREPGADNRPWINSQRLGDGIEVRRNLYKDGMEVSRNLYKDGIEVSRNLYKDGIEVSCNLYKDGIEVSRNLYKDGIEVPLKWSRSAWYVSRNSIPVHEPMGTKQK